MDYGVGEEVEYPPPARPREGERGVYYSVGGHYLGGDHGQRPPLLLQDGRVVDLPPGAPDGSRHQLGPGTPHAEPGPGQDPPGLQGGPVAE